MLDVLNGEAYWLGVAKFSRDDLVQHFSRDKDTLRFVLNAFIAATSLGRLHRLPQGVTTLNAFGQFFEEYDHFVDNVMPRLEKEANNSTYAQSFHTSENDLQSEATLMLPSISVAPTQLMLSIQLQRAPIPLNFYNWPTTGWASPQFKPHIIKDSKNTPLFQILDVKTPLMNLHGGNFPDAIATDFDIVEVLISVCTTLRSAYGQLILPEDLEGTGSATAPTSSTSTASPAGRSHSVHRLKLANTYGQMVAKLDSRFKSRFLSVLADQLSELAAQKFRTIQTQIVEGPKYVDAALANLLRRQEAAWIQNQNASQSDKSNVSAAPLEVNVDDALAAASSTGVPFSTEHL